MPFDFQLSQDKQQLVIYQAKQNLIDFAIATDPQYQDTWLHEKIANILQEAMYRVESGEDVRIILELPPRHGKQCASDTLVPTIEGFKKHGELKVGDYVFGRDHRPTRIVRVIPQEELADVEVKISDGSKVVVHKNHEWTVWDRKKHREVTIETNELIKNLWLSQRGKRGSRARYKLIKSDILKFEKKEVSVDPYTLGIWLGDGSLNKPYITLNPDDYDEIVSRIPYEKKTTYVHSKTKVPTVSYTGNVENCGNLTKDLRDIGVWNNKHIPEKYIFNDESVRRELLAGLVDSDGHIGKSGRVRFVNTNKQLIDDAATLVRSLGYRTTITSQEPKLSTSGIHGRKTVYTLSFSPHDSGLVSHLSRKKVKLKKCAKRRRSVVDYKVVEGKRGECIQVENKDGVYLVTESFIPTHNSEISTIKFPAWIMGHHPDWKIAVASYSSDLATKFGQQARKLMTDPRYQRIFDTQLSADSKAKGYWKSKEGGSYFAAGAGGSFTGTGFKIGIIDDIFKNREEADSKRIRDSRWDWYRSTFYTRQEGSTAIIIINTRWHTDDLVGRLLDQQNKKEKDGEGNIDKWEVVSFPAIAVENEDHRKKGQALWSEMYPIEKLQKTQQALGPYEFSALYQAKPISSENQEFKESWVKYRTSSEVDALDTRNFATIDPGGKGVENDYTGITRNYVDRDNNWNIKVMRVHFASDELIKYIFTLHAEGFEEIGVEETVYLKAIKPFFDLECKKRGVFPRITPLKHGGRNKEVRIRGLIPRYSAGSIYHVDGECSELEEEMFVFPKGANDDAIDSLAYQNDIAKPPVSRMRKKEIINKRRKKRTAAKQKFGL